MERVPRHYAPAALSIGLAAWRAGTDIRQAVQDGGYVYSVAQGVYEYINSSPPDLNLASQASEPAMESRVKRARSSSKGGKVAPAVKTYVKRCMGRLVERKYRTDTNIGGTPTATGTVYNIPLYSITTGTGDNERVGNTINLLYMRYRAVVSDSAALPYTTNTFIRAILVYDRQCNGSAPAVTDILDSASSVAPFNHNTVIGHGGSRFKVLYDKHPSPNMIDPAVAPSTWFESYTKLKGLRTRFDTAGGTIADITSGGLFLLLIGGSNSTRLNGYTEVAYEDA